LRDSGFVIAFSGGVILLRLSNAGVQKKCGRRIHCLKLCDDPVGALEATTDDWGSADVEFAEIGKRGSVVWIEQNRLLELRCDFVGEFVGRN
jgi:hypothetical protein